MTSYLFPPETDLSPEELERRRISRVDEPYEIRARALLKSELRRTRTTYDLLSEKLAALEVRETYRTLHVKINRGDFSASFLLQCLEAIGTREISLDGLDDVGSMGGMVPRSFGEAGE
jgi:hypothetical protein